MTTSTPIQRLAQELRRRRDHHYARHDNLRDERISNAEPRGEDGTWTVEQARSLAYSKRTLREECRLSSAMGVDEALRVLESMFPEARLP